MSNSAYYICYNTRTDIVEENVPEGIRKHSGLRVGVIATSIVNLVVSKMDISI